MGNQLITVTGPSGSGKTTLTKALEARFPDTFRQCISVTTRKPRGQEAHGKDYYFVTDMTFQDITASGDFLESIQFMDRKYGLQKSEVYKILKTHHALFVCEPEGVRQVRKHFPKSDLLNVWIAAPEEVVRRRMLERGDTIESVDARLANDREHFRIDEPIYHHRLVSGSIDQDVEAVTEIVRNELLSSANR